MRRLFVVLALLSFAACGGKSKQETTPEPTPTGGGGGDVYGGGGYGGGAYGGGAYGGGMYGGGEFSCVSGVAECDEMFGKMVACVKTGTKIPDAERGQVVMALQQACESIKMAAEQDPANVAAMAEQCTQAVQASAQQMADEVGCTW